MRSASHHTFEGFVDIRETSITDTTQEESSIPDATVILIMLRVGAEWCSFLVNTIPFHLQVGSDRGFPIYGPSHIRGYVLAWGTRSQTDYPRSEM